MSRLRIFSEGDPTSPRFESSDHARIAGELKRRGVRFERWSASAPLAPGATPDEVVAAYRGDIDRLMRDEGYQSFDVISLNPDHPDKATLRQKFLNEHQHSEDEVRFFVAIRLFTNPAGWVAEFTGDDIAGRFPRLEN